MKETETQYGTKIFVISDEHGEGLLKLNKLAKAVTQPLYIIYDEEHSDIYVSTKPFTLDLGRTAGRFRRSKVSGPTPPQRS